MQDCTHAADVMTLVSLSSLNIQGKYNYCLFFWGSSRHLSFSVLGWILILGEDKCLGRVSPLLAMKGWAVEMHQHSLLTSALRSGERWDFTPRSLLPRTKEPSVTIKNQAKWASRPYVWEKTENFPCLESKTFFSDVQPYPYHYADRDIRAFEINCASNRPI